MMNSTFEETVSEELEDWPELKLKPRKCWSEVWKPFFFYITRSRQRSPVTRTGCAAETRLLRSTLVAMCQGAKGLGVGVWAETQTVCRSGLDSIWGL